MKTTGRWLVLAAVAACLALAAAACGSSGKTNTTSSSSDASYASSARAAGASSGNSAVAKAQQVVRQGENQNQFTAAAPTQSFNPGHHTVAVISVGQNNPAGAKQTALAVTAAKAMGWTPQVFDSGGDVVKYTDYIQQATQSGFSAIIIESLDVENFTGAIKAALAKGIAVGCISACDASGALKGQVLDTGIDWTQEGHLMGAYIVASTGCNAKVMSIEAHEFPVNGIRDEAAAAYVKANCPHSTWTHTATVLADIEKPGPPFWTSALDSAPAGSGKLNVALQGLGDTVAIPMATTELNQGRKDVTIDSYDGFPQFIDMLESGKYPIGATTTGAYAYEAWSAMDLVARKVAHAPVWTGADKLPALLVTRQNVSSVKDPQSWVPPAQANYQQHFESLWKH